LFHANPAIEDAALIELAQDPTNAPVILALASANQRSANSHWLPVLISRMVAAGNYAQARTIWASMSRAGAAGQSPLFDPDFSRPEPPPPFNWSLTSSTVGLAERRPGGRLHAIFYGQEDGVLAQQLLVLQPGRYRLSMQLLPGSTKAQALNWTLTCVGAQVPFASVPLNAAVVHGWSFEVPANCPAQSIQLSGISADLPQQSDVTIGGLRLEGAGADG
jgi:hypothetical protein